MASLKLSKSKKALLVSTGDGRLYVTSVVYLKMLLEGKLKGNYLTLNPIDGADPADLGLEHKSRHPKSNFDISNFE